VHENAGNKMRVGLLQSRPQFGEVVKNLEQAVDALSTVDADLMVLPELFGTGYQFVSKEETFELAEEVPSGRTCRVMTSLAREKNMFLVFGLAEREADRVFNSSFLVGPNGVVGRYRKVHLFSEEKFWFDPGDEGFRVFDVGRARVGMMICFDWIFPESARVLALMGADIICHPANLVLPHCQRAMRTRSLENGVFSITANRVGTEERGGKDPLRFTGGSQVVDNMGKVLTRLDQDDAGILLTDIEPEKARDKSITPQNDRFEDRRPRWYKPSTALE
jgi:predicted amidohydrolase